MSEDRPPDVEVRRMLEVFPDPWVLLEPVTAGGEVVDFRYVDANDAACRYNGMPLADLRGRTLLQLLPGHRDAGLVGDLVECVRTGVGFSRRDVLYANELRGEARVSDIVAEPVDGRLLYTWRDVTERFAALEAATAAQERFRTAVFGMTDPVLVLDGRRHVVMCNPGAAEVLGLSSELLDGNAPVGALEALTDRDGNPLSGERDPLAQVFGAGRPVSRVLVRGRTGRSASRWYRLSVEPLSLDAGGAVSAVLVVLNDVTDLLAAREAQGRATRGLVERERLFRLVFEGSPLGLALVRPLADGDGPFERVNRAMTRMLGLSENRLRTQPFSRFVMAEDLPLVREVFAHALRDDTPPDAVQFRLAHVGGRTVITETHVVPVRMAGDITYLLLQAQDIGPRLKVEGELRRVQRLESIGALAAGIAHEINTPIQFIGDNLAFLSRASRALLAGPGTAADLAADPDAAFMLDEVQLALTQSQEGVERVAGIVRAMRAFGHLDDEHPSPALIDEVVGSALVIARHETKNVADVEVSVADLPPVSCYAGDLRQAILNLVVNAAHAIAERPLRGGLVDRGLIRVSADMVDDALVLTVEDNGVGIRRELHDRVFEPFFTTKPVGQGTGQGLALVHHTVVERHHGRVELESEPGRGTTLRLFIPVVPPESGESRRDDVIG